VRYGTFVSGCKVSYGGTQHSELSAGRLGFRYNASGYELSAAHPATTRLRVYTLTGSNPAAALGSYPAGTRLQVAYAVTGSLHGHRYTPSSYPAAGHRRVVGLRRLSSARPIDGARSVQQRDQRAHPAAAIGGQGQARKGLCDNARVWYHANHLALS